jgi:dinuclear metal center YbgI/SA1388 family protein
MNSIGEKQMKIEVLNNYLNTLLTPERFQDYCPNGLQVEGKQEIHKIVTGVTASMALLQAAQRAKADAILVHHGYFWRGESLPIVGIKKQRIAFLLAHELNLFAYHLSLDAHPEVGNNVQLAKKLDLTISAWAGDKNILAIAELPETQALQTFVQKIEQRLARQPLVVGDLQRSIRKVALCTGAAQSYIEAAVAEGVDVFISGEISEQTVHIARETGVSYISAGHHATERYGIQALGVHLAEKFNLAHEFIDIENPV